MVDNVAYKHHQYGHCKFGQKCRRFHTRHTCDNPICDKNLCSSRHPKPCTYHFQFGHFQFGANCSFLHSELPTKHLETEIIKLQENFKVVFESCISKDIEIKKLSKIIIELENGNAAGCIKESFKC